jgi:hypothetical protein
MTSMPYLSRALRTMPTKWMELSSLFGRRVKSCSPKCKMCEHSDRQYCRHAIADLDVYKMHRPGDGDAP